MNVTSPLPAPHRGALLDAARRAVAGPPGRVALRLSGLPLAPRRRRVLRLLVQDAAEAAGGQVFDTAGGEMLLLGAPAGTAERTAALLAELAGPVGAVLWHLPADSDRLLAWAETAGPPPAASPAPAAPSPAGLDALLARLRPEDLVRRPAILRLGATMALSGRLLAIPAEALAGALGPLAQDPDLRRHAEDALARCLPPLLAVPGPLNPPGTLLVPLALDAQPGPAPRPGLVGVLPLQAAADPDALTGRRAALAGQGWGLAIAGLDAAALRLAAPEAIPADWLLLAWSAAMPEPRHGLPPAVAARCLLLGCDGAEAFAWGLARGIRHFAGPHVERLLAAARLAHCREAAG